MTEKYTGVWFTFVTRSEALRRKVAWIATNHIAREPDTAENQWNGWKPTSSSCSNHDWTPWHVGLVLPYMVFQESLWLDILLKGTVAWQWAHTKRFCRKFRYTLFLVKHFLTCYFWLFIVQILLWIKHAELLIIPLSKNLKSRQAWTVHN